MLRLTVPSVELYDDEKGEFIETKEQTLLLEHSLVSLSKWESKWCKAFFSKAPKTDEEILDYIKCMTITQNVKPEVYNCLTVGNIEDVQKYIEAPMTATYISDSGSGSTSRETVTSELIYFWMISLNIPFKCEKWHLNRLLMLIKVCNVKNSPPKPRSMRERMSRNTSLNAARRKRLNTRG